jgi:hypothetical protein
LNPWPPRCERGALPLSYTPRMHNSISSLVQYQGFYIGEHVLLSTIRHRKLDQRLKIFFIVCFNSPVSADFTIYPSEAQLEKSCLNSP